LNIIENNQDFVKWLRKVDDDHIKRDHELNSYRHSNNTLRVDNLTIEKLEIRRKHFETTEFQSCVFFNCNFTSSLFFVSTLINCKFINCHFTWTDFIDVDLISCEFIDCRVYQMNMSDAIINNTVFTNCTDITDLRIRGDRDREIKFKTCYIQELRIEPISSKSTERYIFANCLIKESSFYRVDFKESAFEYCNLALNQFNGCSLSDHSLMISNSIPGKEYNFIDIRSILNSVPLGEKVLENLFGIHNRDIKEYLVDMTSKIEFQSIFISYSFHDSKFAKLINEELKRRGIITFLWEKDSKAGERLTKIMSDGINEKDRVLFISSEYSLKSKACHFELTEGRKKQELSWENVLFPIHLDNYLFDLEKDVIRPIEKQDEYWENITELKRLNSLSFIEFINPSSRNQLEFEKQIFRLIEGLRK